jgi:hypothetical protein
VELWGVLENDFDALDEKNMSHQEKFNCQLNFITTHKIHQCLNREVHDQVVKIESSKELWDKLTTLF